MSTSHSHVIIGNGIAGVTAAEILRREDPACTITIVADDPFPVYYRPALKDFLGGRLAEEKLWARPATFYQQQRIRFVPARVTGILPSQHGIQLHNGQKLGYQTLLLANGARPRTLSCPGLDLAGVFTLRTVADYQEILRRLERVNRVVIVGSGTLALESAETLCHAGYQVTHLLRGTLLWSEVLDPVASDMVLQEERNEGIEVCTGEEIAQILGRDGQVSGVVTSQGRRLPCELVLIAVGIEPLIDFIRGSGIICGRGVKVDSQMRTSERDIFAAGDVIETTDKLTGRTRVLGQWFPAIQQAQVAAYNMLATTMHSSQSDTQQVSATLYNATFLYGLDFVSIGLTTSPQHPGFQELVAEPQARNYRKVILYHGKAVGALLLGERGLGMALKRAIDHQVNLAAIASYLFTKDFDLDEWLSQQGVPAPLFSEARQPASELDSATAALTRVEREGGQQAASPEVEGYFVPVPHPEVHVSVAEMRLDKGTREKAMMIGRKSSSSWRIDHRSVSRLHAEVSYASEAYWLCDAGSANGTFVNGTRLAPGSPYQLRPRDQVRFGDVQFRFELRPRTAQGVPERTGSTAGISRVLPTIAAQEARKAASKGQKAVAVGMEHRKKTAALQAEQLQFEIDMCIGCNRCMDVCPVPLSNQVTIAALNQATVADSVTPTVERFTHDCVMCGSCVPICPVDNHRDLLMLALKKRLGVSWESRPDMGRVAPAIPPGWALLQFMQRLREQAFLSEPQQVPENYLLHIIASARSFILEPGAVLLQEGEYGHDLYLILEGQIELSTTDQGEKELPVAILRRGEYVGEEGMLTGLPYKASARARERALLFQVPEQVIQRLMELVPDVRQHFDQSRHARSLYAILARLPFFEGVAGSDLQWLISQTAVRSYERGERLFAEEPEGRPPREMLHILLEGFVKVVRHISRGAGTGQSAERIVAYRQGGDYFVGGLDLLGDGQAATVTTINRCRVAQIPEQAMRAFVQRYPQVQQRFSQRLKDYLQTAEMTRDRRAGSIVAEGLHALVSDGVVEGAEVLVIDLDKCIHCNECEFACERRHGHSRMNRKGMVIGNISITTTCRHCQDPVCMLCSRAGIARHANGEVYITESCIGCGICAERCPYGAISIAQVDDDAPEPGSWRRFSAWFPQMGRAERSRKALPVVNSSVAGGSVVALAPLDTAPGLSGYDEMRKKIAIKCDLCAGYSDQACVQACPAGAAFRVQPTKFFGDTEDILRRRAKEQFPG